LARIWVSFPGSIFPAGYHFGGHTFVACGFDGRETALGSDMEAKTAGVKKGFYAPISLERLRKARGSTFKPFPPKNLWFEFDFARFHAPQAKTIAEAIAQTADAQLHPPIKNFGVSGMRHTAAQLPKWPSLFNDFALRMNLFNLYIFIEIGGTGGGAFRAMYARFLDEARRLQRSRCGPKQPKLCASRHAARCLSGSDGKRERDGGTSACGWPPDADVLRIRGSTPDSSSVW
jgi:hypothetical protein